jgi:hypothetical protein
MMLRAPETEALDEGNAQKGFGVSILDRSPFPRAQQPPMIPQGYPKPCGSRNTATQIKRISAIINNHRGTSGSSYLIVVFSLYDNG